jgi:hypothetical protein
MTPDERNMLQDLAAKIAQTPAPPRDAEAEEFIRKNIGSRPDALYLMTQTVLIQNLALQQAQQQIQALQQRASQPAAVGSGSFLGGQSTRPGGYAQPSGQYAQQYAAPPPPQYAPPSQSVPSPGGGASSFLRGAAQTAAGVAGGVLAADAISSLFGHHGGGFGGFGGPGFVGGAPVEEVVNNYYETPAPEMRADDRGEYAADQNQYDDQGQDDDGAQYQDASYDSGDDGGGFDDSGDMFA